MPRPSISCANEDGTSWLELCVDPEEGIASKLERKELRQHLAHALGQIPERERNILAMYYEEELTLAEIGEVIGVGESRVSQLRSQAISRLRTILRDALAPAAAADVPQRKAS
jgi:RNA polymerase sigma factor for flagellar operon FliA